MKKVKNVKLLPIIISLATISVGFSLSKKDVNQKNKMININHKFTGDELDTFNNLENTEPTTSTTFESTNESITTTTTFEIEEETIATTVNEYQSIMFLDGVDSNYTVEEINDLIVKYSSYSLFTYDEAISIIEDNLEYITSNYSSLETGIMCILFDTASERGLLSSYCNYDKVERRDMTRDEQETIMLEICDSFGISNDDKTIVLAVFRHETGNGTSSRCVNDNNYGGIYISSIGDFGIYQTPEYGMYRAIKCIIGHIERVKNKTGSSDVYNIIYGMSFSYCPGTASDWTSKVFSMYGQVDSYYNSFEDNYELKLK